MAEVRDNPTDRRIGTLVGGRWRLESRLGEGGMATVYAARDPSGARAAVKVLHEEMGRKADVRARFLREAYVANRIGHPGAVQILDHGEGQETYLVMELLEGVPLSVRLQRASEITLRELLTYADQILDVLARAHEQGIVHRDIKPDNVFVTHTGQVKILDFGIARVLDDVGSQLKTRTGLALGTIPYMAPEQALGKRTELDGRADLFALGAMLFRVLAGRRIHEAPSEAELLVSMATQPAPKLGSVAPGVPEVVCAIVDNALAFSRDARYPNARTMQGDVRAVLSGTLPPYVRTGTPAHLDAPTRIEAAPPRSLDATATRVSAGPLSAPGGRDAATRVEAARHGGSPQRGIEAPPVSQPAGGPSSLPARSMAMPATHPAVSMASTALSGAVPMSQPPVSLAAPMSQSPVSLAAPMSQPPVSLAAPHSMPTTALVQPAAVPAVAAPRRKGGVLLVALLGGGTLLVTGALAATAVAFGVFGGADGAGSQSAPSPGAPEATGATADGVIVPSPTPGQSARSAGQPASGGGSTQPGSAGESTPGAPEPAAEPAAAQAAAPSPEAPGNAGAPAPAQGAPGSAPAPTSAPTAAPTGAKAASTAAAAPTTASTPSPPPTTTSTRAAAAPSSPTTGAAPAPAPTPTSTGGGRPSSGQGSQGQGKAKGKSKPK